MKNNSDAWTKEPFGLPVIGHLHLLDPKTPYLRKINLPEKISKTP